jgi:hypothetical protein
MLNIDNKVPKYSQHNEECLVGAMLGRLAPAERFCVDIGAHDGVEMSNTLAVYRQGWRGLAVEAEAEAFAKLARNYEDLPEVELVRCLVTPENVVSLLRAHGVPREFGFLNLDIDSYDYFVLERVLAEFRPRLIVTEINEIIPPPIRFAVKFEPGQFYKFDGFQGQSLAQLMVLAGRQGYALTAVEYNNAFLVPEEINPFPALTAEQGWREGYMERPDRDAFFPWNKAIAPALLLPAVEVVAMFQEMFAAYGGKYLLEV